MLALLEQLLNPRSLGALNSQYEPSRGELGCGRARTSGGGLGALNVVTAILPMGSGTLTPGGIMRRHGGNY